MQLWQRDEQQVPSHHIQIDVKFLNFTDKSGKRVRRYQYTTLDDATRLRALIVYERYNTDDVGLNEKLAAWENVYNYFRPHRSLTGKTPYEVLSDKLQCDRNLSRS